MPSVGKKIFFTEAESARIDDLSAGGDVNIWARSSEGAGEE